LAAKPVTAGRQIDNETGSGDDNPIVGRTFALSQVIYDQRAFDGPTAQGAAVITDFVG
jgi:hypothetical protein